MSFSAFIDDGYNETGFIKESEGLYPAVTFEYRPFTSSEWMRYLDKADDKVLAKNLDDLVKALKDHLKSWDLRDRNENIVPITTDTLKKLKHVLLKRIFAIVTCQEPSDEHPKATTPNEEADGKN